MSLATATYALIPSASLEPAGALCESLFNCLVDSRAVHLARRVASETRWQDLPEAPRAVEGGGRVITQSWLASPAWLETALQTGVPDEVLAHVVVAVSWPVGAEAEMALLGARLTTSRLRVAVTGVEHGVPEAVFSYFNRLGFPWIALPGSPGRQDWGQVMATLFRLWCTDQRTRTPMEPALSGFGALLGDSSQPSVQWACRVIDETGAVRAFAPVWSPSMHAVLVGSTRQVSVDELLELGRTDRQWIEGVKDLLGSVDLKGLAQKLTHPAVPATPGGRS